MVKPDWSAFYENLEEELPPQLPEALGYPVHIHVFVNAIMPGICSEFTDFMGKLTAKYCGNVNIWN
jgi:hypothetical protein